jgi:sugar phosphate isomerase/epimerase
VKIAYGTYAMPTVPLEEALPALARIGYDGVEIAIGPRHVGSLPDQLTPDRRARLRDLLAAHRLGVPALFTTGCHILEVDDQTHRDNLELVGELAGLYHDLGTGERPVVALGIGGKSEEWDGVRDQIVRCARDYAAVASDRGFVVAGEAHKGAAVDRTERALWVIDSVDSAHLRLHFDMVHFFLAGESIEHAVPALVPVTAHTHVTDARKHADGTAELLLLGQGELDTTAYVRAMHQVGWTSYITLEVSAAVWSKPDYDPFDAAEFSYRTIDRAFRDADVPRG